MTEILILRSVVWRWMEAVLPGDGVVLSGDGDPAVLTGGDGVLSFRGRGREGWAGGPEREGVWRRNE